ncbi:hypothetical protein QCA50_014370 [Cerrena zonata]|uniref:Uncharacterized protein n=1 Tax=Cerrena zonata TaxID=2478898 RepID=A0AAW0G0N5_9APHY
MQNPNQSTSTLQTIASTTPLQGSSSPKDFENAFGSLQSSFGFGGVSPTTIPRTLPGKKTSWFRSKQQTTSPSSAPSSAPSSLSSPPPSAPSNTKDYEAAFGSLSSNFGFGPSPNGPSPVGRTSTGGKRSK